MNSVCFSQTYSELEDSIDATHLINHNRAIYFLEKIKPLHLQKEKYESFILASHDIADNYFELGNFEKAEEYIEQALSEAKKYNLSNSDKVYSYIWNFYGFLADEKDNWLLSISYFKKALLIDEKLEDLSPIYKAYRYNNLGSAYQELGDYQKAIGYYKESLSIAKSLEKKDEVLLVTLNNNLGFNYADLKRFKKAEEYYLKTYQLLQEFDKKDNFFNWDYKVLYNNFANLYIETKEHQKAMFYLQKKLKRPFLTPRDYAGVYRRIGKVLHGEQKYDLAIDTLNVALKIRKETYYPKNHYIGEVHRNIGDVFISKKDYNEALQSYQNAIISVVIDFDDKNVSSLPKIEKVIHPVDLLKSLSAKGKTLHLLNKNREALATYQLCTELIDQMRTSFEHNNSKLFLMEEGMIIYEKAIEIALEIGDKEVAYELVEKSKAMLLLEAVRGIDARFGLSEELLNQERTLKIDISYYERQIWNEEQKGEETNQEQITKWESLIFDLKEEYQRFKEQIEKDYPDYYQLQYNTTVVSVKEAQRKLLNRKTALLTYFIGTNKVYVFSISKKDIEVYTFAKKGDLTNLVSTFRKCLKRDYTLPSLHLTYYEVAHQLYQDYLKIAITDLPKSIQRIIIIPDGQLNFVPFEALLTSKPVFENARYEIGKLPYLIRNYQITYGYSATLLLEGQKQRPVNNLQTFGGFAPTFKGTSERRGCDDAILGDLPFGQQNIVAINEIMDGALHFDEAATLQNFKDIANQYKILHLCTHACASSDLKDTRIFFTDQELLAFELYNMPLQARLAVLSACETGIGELKRSEGVMSLARAFMYSGCPSVVTSLWSVDDKSTSELMLHFYKNLKDGMRQDEALHQAKLDYLDAKGIDASHPYYWSGFVHIGNNEALFSSSNHFGYLKWLIGGIVFLGLIGFFFIKRK